MNHAIALQPLDWLNLFFYYISISLLAVGGAIATAPDMHRFLVERQGWLTDLQFNASIAIAQAAPGPNVLFIALLGWNVGKIVAFFEKLFGVHLINSQIYFIDYLPSDVNMGDVAFIACISLVLAFLATLYPSWRAAKTQPAEALRYE